jgi:putative transposase
MGDSSTHLKTFKYRLYPSKRQERNLFRVLACARSFYNMCLAERKWTYELEGRSVSKTEQLRQVKHYKATFPQAEGVHSHILQVAASDCDKAFQAFFRRVKVGGTPGYPRFKNRDRFHSFGLKEYGNGWKIDGRKLDITGVGRVSVRWHRSLEGTPKTLRVIHKAGQWYITIVCEVPDTAPLPETGRVIGLDMGISALVTTSEGEKVEDPKFYREAQAELRRRQRKLARAKRGSKNRWKAKRQVQRWHEHVANQRRDFAHKLSTELVQQYDGIALENLRVTNMARNKHLSKSILDSGWSMFRQFLTYKAASAGRVTAFVDPAYTSKTCSCCGAILFRPQDGQHLTLSDRWVNCDCGLSMDRDHNAAVNILRKAGWDTPVGQNVDAGQVMRAQEATRLANSFALPL